MTLAEIQTGISYFQQAIALDPSYGLAYVGLADAYRSALAGDMSPMELLPKAKAAAQKAIEIDDTLADAHAELGFIIFWYDWDWTFLIHAGRSDEALGSLQKVFEMDPNYYFAHFFASSAYIEKGMFSEAIAEARKAIELSGRTNSHPMGFLGYALAKSGKQVEAKTVLAELLRSSDERYVSPYNIALIYNSLGERNETLAWLDRAYDQRDQRMVFLKVEPKWNNLRGDEHFQRLMTRVGFTQ